MVAKIFAGVLAVAVLGTGGYVYWQASNEGTPSCDGVCQASVKTASCCSEESEEVSSCCQSGSRVSMLEAFAKACENPTTNESFEVLAIQPREVK